MKNGTSLALARILSDADLVAQVRELPARALAEVIERVGLEDAAEIVALATTEQLVGVFDEDLWKSAVPGKDETFDDARFSLWLEVLAESGDDHVAKVLADLPEDLVILAVQRRMFVFDLDTLAASVGEDARADKALASTLSHELESWLLVAREHDGWDTLLAALVTLDRDDHDLLERILARVAAATEAEVEDSGGLYEVLTEAETIAEDVAAEREERRSREGFVAPSAATAFLRLALVSSLDELAGMKSDPITRGYFRDLDRTRPADVPHPSRLREILRDAEAPTRRALPRARKPTKLALALDVLPAAARARIFEELAYLTNIVVAGVGLRPFDAAERVMATCDRGLTHLVKSGTREALLAEEGSAVKAFRVGWHLENVKKSPSSRR